MLIPLMDSYQSTLDHLPSSLFSTENKIFLESQLASLPDAMSLWGLEFRLGSHAGRVDLGTVVILGEGLTLFHRFVRRKALTEPEPESTGWRCLERFCREWGNKKSLLNKTIPYIFLEFDIYDSSLKAPSLFFSLQPTEGPAISCSKKLKTIHLALSLLSTPDYPSGQQDLITKCLKRLESVADIRHVGLMLSRPRSPARLFICTTPNLFSKSLKALKISSDQTPIVTSGPVTDDLLRFNPGKIEFQVILTDKIEHYLDLEFAFDPQPPVERRWEQLISFFVQQGWCSSDQKKALLGWPGLLIIPTEHQTTHIAAKCLSHLKLKLGSETTPVAKAYLTITPTCTLY